MNVLDVIGYVWVFTESRHSTLSNPDEYTAIHHRVGFAPAKKKRAFLESATTYPSFIVFGNKKGLKAT